MKMLDNILRFYDAETGVEEDQSIARREAAAIAKALEDSERLAALAKHPGWLLVKEAMEADILAGQEALLDLSNPALMAQRQEFVKARRQLLYWIEGKIREGQSLADNQAGLTADNLRSTHE